ncbi:MAG: hypothetical protein Q9175_006518 [Cornicularia normoerica]
MFEDIAPRTFPSSSSTRTLLAWEDILGIVDSIAPNQPQQAVQVDGAVDHGCAREENQGSRFPKVDRSVVQGQHGLQRMSLVDEHAAEHITVAVENATAKCMFEGYSMENWCRAYKGLRYAWRSITASGERGATVNTPAKASAILTDNDIKPTQISDLIVARYNLNLNDFLNDRTKE